MASSAQTAGQRVINLVTRSSCLNWRSRVIAIIITSSIPAIAAKSSIISVVTAWLKLGGAPRPRKSTPPPRSEVRLASPDRPRHRQLGQRLSGGATASTSFTRSRNRFPMSISEAFSRRTGPTVKHQPHRVGLATNAQRMHLERWPALGNAGTNLQHVRPQHQVAPRIEMIGVILHERRAALRARPP